MRDINWLNSLEIEQKPLNLEGSQRALLLTILDNVRQLCIFVFFCKWLISIVLRCLALSRVDSKNPRRGFNSRRLHHCQCIPAAEIVAERADATKPNMGLTKFRGEKRRH